MNRMKFRSLTLALFAGAALAAAGCGGEPETPTIPEADREEMIRKDSEQLLKERQQSGQQRPPR